MAFKVLKHSTEKVKENQNLKHDENHVYKDKRGFPVISVSKFLEKIGVSKPYNGDPWYGRRGTAVHKMLELHERELAHEDILEQFENERDDYHDVKDSDIESHIETGLKIIKEEEDITEVIALELPLRDKKQKLAGTTDRVVKRNGKICLDDWKTSKKISKPYMYQLGLYAVMYEQMYGEKVYECRAISTRTGEKQTVPDRVRRQCEEIVNIMQDGRIKKEETRLARIKDVIEGSFADVEEATAESIARLKREADLASEAYKNEISRFKNEVGDKEVKYESPFYKISTRVSVSKEKKKFDIDKALEVLDKTLDDGTMKTIRDTLDETAKVTPGGKETRSIVVKFDKNRLDEFDTGIVKKERTQKDVPTENDNVAVEKKYQEPEERETVDIEELDETEESRVVIRGEISKIFIDNDVEPRDGWMFAEKKFRKPGTSLSETDLKRLKSILIKSGSSMKDMISEELDVTGVE